MINREEIDEISNEEIKAFLLSLSPIEGSGFDSFIPHADPVAKKLLEDMLRFDPKKRITPKDALESPFFQGMRHPDLEVSTLLLLIIIMKYRMHKQLIREYENLQNSIKIRIERY